MRVIVALRPTNRHGTKGEYTSFRKLLIATGFVLIQPEVFIATVASGVLHSILLPSLGILLHQRALCVPLCLPSGSFHRLTILLAHLRIRSST